MLNGDSMKDTPMRMGSTAAAAGAAQGGAVPLTGAAGGAEFVERRAVTPLVFESVERRRENLKQAGVDLVQEAARAQDLATLEALRAQVRSMPGQIDAARAQATAEARAAWEAELAARIEAERAPVARVCTQFAAERERYFVEVEGEVVRLALGIAERVLHRETQMDPMLLAASVRLALEKVAGETGTVLRVPVDVADQWRALFGEGADRAAEVVGDERLSAGECVLETNVGRVELGLAVQLEEIEKGFFDLLQKRPA